MNDGPTLFAEGEVDATFTVGELNQAIINALGTAFPQALWVRGEVQQLSNSRNGHTYFELVEKDGGRDRVRAVLRVALFRGDRPAVNQALGETGVRLTDGVEIRIQGRVDFYPANGRLQLVMRAIDPVFTVGRLAADRARVLRVLAQEGLLARNAGLALSAVPLRIGLVTSGGSAAFRDFLHGLEETSYAFRVAHCDVRVQGSAASRRVAWALRQLGALDLDVIALVRGGGARSDLAAFDSEIVARAIAELPVPVFTGIGHEVDRTVADEVAHTCCKTPTAVAAELVAIVTAYDDELSRLAHHISSRARSSCALAQRRIEELGRRAGRDVPMALRRERQTLAGRHRRVRDAGGQVTRVNISTLVTHERALVALATRALRGRVDRVEGIEARVRALDPRRVLERGYTITRRADGEIVKGVSQVTAGEVLTTETRDGQVHSRVEDK